MNYWKMRSEECTEKQMRILFHLRRAIEQGKIYFKSKDIAKDLGLSSQEIGANMVILSSICDDLEITRWGYSGSSTTWKITSKPDMEKILERMPEPTPVQL